MPRIHVLPDEEEIESQPGETILETCLRAGLAPAHACGGEARCTTCRVWIMDGLTHCSPRNTKERDWALNMHFDDHLRLACQTAITGDVKLRRLVLDDADLDIVSQLGREDSTTEGHEKRIAIMFADIRGFTSFSEPLPPYDVLFVLNRYFRQMGQLIERHGGYIDNYMGDGLMALFGVDDAPDAALRAVTAGIAMLEAMDDLKPYLADTYDQSLEMGIGVHYGSVVIGTMGYAKSRKLATIGDAVNFTSRIESANKEARTRFLISEDAYHLVKDHLQVGRQVSVDLKGKSGKHTLHEVTGLAKVEPASSSGSEDQTGRKVVAGIEWVRVLPDKDLPPDARQVVKVNGLGLVLINQQGRIIAIEDRCPHMRLPLQRAKITDDFCLVCPWHHSTFDLQSGELRKWAPWPPVMGPALGLLRNYARRPLKVWPARRDEGYVWVAPSDLEPADQQT